MHAKLNEVGVCVIVLKCIAFESIAINQLHVKWTRLDCVVENCVPNWTLDRNVCAFDVTFGPDRLITYVTCMGHTQTVGNVTAVCSSNRSSQIPVSRAPVNISVLPQAHTQISHQHKTICYLLRINWILIGSSRWNRPDAILPVHMGTAYTANALGMRLIWIRSIEHWLLTQRNMKLNNQTRCASCGEPAKNSILSSLAAAQWWALSCCHSQNDRIRIWWNANACSHQPKPNCRKYCGRSICSIYMYLLVSICPISFRNATVWRQAFVSVDFSLFLRFCSSFVFVCMWCVCVCQPTIKCYGNFPVRIPTWQRHRKSQRLNAVSNIAVLFAWAGEKVYIVINKSHVTAVYLWPAISTDSAATLGYIETKT